MADTCCRINTLLNNNVPRVIENYTIGLAPEKEQGLLEVMLYVSFECEDEDEIEDLFQAVIDTLCSNVAHESDTYDKASLQIMYPGAVGDEDMYEAGDMARLDYEKNKGCIDVKVYKVGRAKPVTYLYEVIR